MLDDRMDLIYRESTRALEQQQSVLDNLRTRIGVLVAAASITTSFLGGRAMAGSSAFGCWGWAAIGCFAGVGLLTLLVLRPQPGWFYSHNVDKFLDRYDNHEEWATLAGMQRRLADANQSNWEDNRDKLRRMQREFSLACGLLVAEVGFWLIDVLG